MKHTTGRLAELYPKITSGQEWILDNVIFLSRTGSWLYGTNHEKSDTDYVGVTIAPLDYWVGTKVFEQFIHDETTIYDVRKYLKLAVDSNPNIIELLFIEKDNPNVQVWSDLWQNIRDLRHEWISKKAFHTFSGYSHSQRQKLVVKQGNKTGRRYITDEFNFDVKFAMHAIRLLTQGIELLTTKEIKFPRPDRQHLLDIRQGKVYDNLTKFFEDIDKLDQGLKEAEEKSPLNHSGNKVLLNDFQVDIFNKYVSV